MDLSYCSLFEAIWICDNDKDKDKWNLTHSTFNPYELLMLFTRFCSYYNIKHQPEFKRNWEILILDTSLSAALRQSAASRRLVLYHLLHLESSDHHGVTISDLVSNLYHCIESILYCINHVLYWIHLVLNPSCIIIFF